MAQIEEEGFYLTQADVDRLLQDHSADSRLNVVTKIVHHYEKDHFSSQELHIAERIFRLLMKDAEIRVREALSEQIKHNTKVPRDIVLHLAKDAPSVSNPILEHSRILSDADLIKVVESTHEIAALKAISRRERVSERVSDALIDTHYPQVVKELLSNSGSHISDKGYEHIMDEFRGDEDVEVSLVKRSGLPITIVEKLVTYVSDQLVQELEARYKGCSTSLREEQENSRAATTLELIEHEDDEEAIDQLAAQMVASGRLSPSIIMMGLCRGNMHFFESALGRMANIPKSNARKLIRDKGELGFSRLYAKTGLPESMFEAVRVMLDVVLGMEGSDRRPGSVGFANRVVEQLIAYAENHDVENLSYIIALVRQQTLSNIR